jgi:hypothetical protein
LIVSVFDQPAGLGRAKLVLLWSSIVTPATVRGDRVTHASTAVSSSA